MELIELHYYLAEGSHSIDAFVKNKAEADLLRIFKEVSDSLDLDLTFEIEALAEGGVKEFFKVLRKKKTKKQVAKLMVAIGIIITSVIANVVSDKITTNSELEASLLEESKLHIEKLKKDLEKQETTEEESQIIIENITIILLNNDKIKFHRSNFYTNLLKETKIEKISTVELDQSYEPISDEKTVDRSDFRKFIIDKIKIDSEFIENANIQIVSPVLNSSQMKWRGYYDSKPISFNLRDPEFRNSVLNRKISFQNGTSITCLVELQKEMDNDGNVKVSDVNVFNVTHILEGEVPIITKKGKEIREAKKQTKIDFNADFDD
jgi:hypothetical protein